MEKQIIGEASVILEDGLPTEANLTINVLNDEMVELRINKSRVFETLFFSDFIVGTVNTKLKGLLKECLNDLRKNEGDRRT